jgi:hypothetical protein
MVKVATLLLPQMAWRTDISPVTIYGLSAGVQTVFSVIGPPTYVSANKYCAVNKIKKTDRKIASMRAGTGNSLHDK